MSHVHDGLNDDQLLGALHAAITARRAVPVKFVQTATDAYAWHDIYAELARLSCDCGRDRDMLALLSRSPPGRLKAPPSLVASLLSPGGAAALWLAGETRPAWSGRP